MEGVNPGVPDDGPGGPGGLEILVWNPPSWAPPPGPRGGSAITHDRARLADAAAVVFHIPTLSSALRLPKPAGQLWVAWSMESAAMYPALADPRYMAAFDLTMTYRLDADVPTPYFEPHLLADLASPPAPKSEPAPAVLFLSNGEERSGRTAYARELMNHLAVDSYGRCLNNRTLAVDRGRASLRETIRRYRFTLAFENSIAVDYVTEKFFGPLAAGSVPVYLGAPNVADFAPGEHCYLDVRDFASPRDLAAHLTALAGDDEAYAALLAWKRRPLRDELLRRFAAFSSRPFDRLDETLRRRQIRHGERA
jgi:hypothetical protein